MFFRVKPALQYRYLQIARSVRVGKTMRQEITATLGRLDILQESGQLDRHLRSAADNPKRWKTTAVQERGRISARSALECASPLALWIFFGAGVAAPPTLRQIG